MPRSIAARTILVLLLGLMISHLVSMAIYYGDRTAALSLLGGGHIAERIATVTQMIEATPGANRGNIVELVSRPAFRVARSTHPARRYGVSPDWRSRLMRDVLRDHMGGIEDSRIAVDYVYPEDAGQGTSTPDTPGVTGALDAPPPTNPEVGGRLGRDPTLYVSIQLADRSWLNFALPATEVAPLFSLRFVLSIAVMAGGVIVLAIWAVRWVTAPLATFARAAEALGVDVNAPPLPEAGPEEVRRAARTFNEMQQRLRRYINDRTRMLAAISHDLRTPITRLRLRSEFVEDTEQQQKMLADLDEMEAMIASVLTFARNDAAEEPQDVLDLAALVQSVCDDMADTGQSVEFHHQGRLPVAGRPMALRRALTNVIENAVKYGERAHVDLIESEGQVTVRIDDDGPGIPEGDVEAVFEPFYRLERSRSRETGGAGLGLCVARTIIRAHGGDITICNRAEGGLRAEIVIPT